MAPGGWVLSKLSREVHWAGTGERAHGRRDGPGAVEAGRAATGPQDPGELEEGKGALGTVAEWWRCRAALESQRGQCLQSFPAMGHLRILSREMM